MDDPRAGAGQAIYAVALEYNERQNMSKTTTTGRTDKALEPIRAMTDDEVMAAAWSDPDAQPLTPDDFAKAYLHVIARNPQAVIDALTSGCSAQGSTVRGAGW
jgi:hypothetical protein